MYIIIAVYYSSQALQRMSATCVLAYSIGCFLGTTCSFVQYEDKVRSQVNNYTNSLYIIGLD